MGALALAGLATSRALRTGQARLAHEAASTDPMPTWALAPDPRHAAPRGWRAFVLPAAAVAGLLLAVGSLTAYQQLTEQERAHVSRAQPAQAQAVTYTDDDFRQVFEVRDGPRAGSRVRIEVVEALATGTESTVLLDPTDRTWAALVSQPQDDTFWLGWSLLGALVALWSGVQLVAWSRAGRGDQESTMHRVRVTRDGWAELTLARDVHPVARVRLDPVRAPTERGGAVEEPFRSSRTGSVPVLVRGRLADGGWVALTSERGALPVVGPVEALPRWRGIDTDTDTWDRWLGPAMERARFVGAAMGQVALAGLSVVLIYFALDQVGPAWEAARGRGVPGQLTIMSESCSKICDYAGSFRSDDGRHTFTDVALVGASGPIGSRVPAFYEGDGDVPDAVYGHGWGGVVESGVFLGAALVMIGGPLRRALQVVVDRRHRAGPDAEAAEP